MESLVAFIAPIFHASLSSSPGFGGFQWIGQPFWSNIGCILDQKCTADANYSAGVAKQGLGPECDGVAEQGQQLVVENWNLLRGVKNCPQGCDIFGIQASTIFNSLYLLLTSLRMFVVPGNSKILLS